MDTKEKPYIHCLTLAERVAVIRGYEKNLTVRQLAEQFKCGKTQIRNILHRREGYLEEWKNNGDPNSMRLRKSNRNLLIQLVVHEWIKRSRAYSPRIDDAAIQSIGFQTSRLLGVVEHRSSKRWLERFKRKYKLDRPGALAPILNAERKSLDLQDIIDAVMPEMDETCHNVSESDNSSSGMHSIFNSYVPLEDDHTMYPVVQVEEVKPIESYKEALNCLGPLEHFALMEENIRVIGLLNQVENIFRDEIARGST